MLENSNRRGKKMNMYSCIFYDPICLLTFIICNMLFTPWNVLFIPMTIKGDNVVNIWKTQWRHFVFSVLIKVATSMHNSKLYRGAGISHLLASVLEQAPDMQCWYNQLHCHKFPYISLGHCKQLGLSPRKDKIHNYRLPGCLLARGYYLILWWEGHTYQTSNNNC